MKNANQTIGAQDFHYRNKNIKNRAEENELFQIYIT
jgi:hypothetical protein